MGPAKRDADFNDATPRVPLICWLGEEDSNPRYVVQSHASYH